MGMPRGNDFIFSPKYRPLRHILFWLTWYLSWVCFWSMYDSYIENGKRIVLWMPVFIFYTYPVSHFAVIKLLLKNRQLYFLAFILSWSVVGWYLNIYFRRFVFFPVLDLWKVPHSNGIDEPQSLLCMATTVACFSAAILLKHWVVTQKEAAEAKQEKMIAQLQVLKAQLHPHFLFNTLNNIYSFALENSSKTPQMVLRLSSLLSYMLYDCKADEVLLEKELEVMKNYVDLEKERYGDKIDISVNIEGDIHDRYITPLLILPFLENAFKHGTSEQLERPWMSVDIAVKDHLLECKVVNSKNEFVPFHENGVGINNVKKRLEFLYPGKHDLKLADEGVFFVVSLFLQLKPNLPYAITPVFSKKQFESITHEIALSSDRR